MANNYTTFPDSVQVFELKTDVSSNVYSDWIKFNTYITKGEFANATELLQSNTELQKCIIDSGYMNKLSKTIEEVQTLFLNDIHTYIHETIIDKGLWSDEYKYVKYNFVTYPVNGIIQTFECLRDDTPIATLPTNTTYWIPRVIQGEKGDSGIGLTPKGIWNSMSVYLKDDFVAYGNAFWQCLNQNSNSIPTDENTNWLKLMDLNDELETAITGKLTEYALKSEIPTSLPANGGNSDTVDGSHAWQMQTLSADGSTHGTGGYQLTCKHNVKGDSRFRFQIEDGSQTSVDFADNAGNADVLDGKHAVDFEPNQYLPVYSKRASDLSMTYPLGISIVFVQPSDGWFNYGQVITSRGYEANGGSTIQIYIPYSPSLGGASAKVRFGNYSNDGKWTEWQTYVSSIFQTTVPTALASGTVCYVYE